jgi:hypothetical protein
LLHLVWCKCVFDRLIGAFSYLFLSLDLFFVL